MLTAEQKAKWLARLRDPAAKKNSGSLFDACFYDKTYITSGNAMCCLGHGAFALDHESFDAISIYGFWHKHLGIGATDELVKMNDKEQCTLTQIADYIEANIPTEN